MKRILSKIGLFLLRKHWVKYKNKASMSFVSVEGKTIRRKYNAEIYQDFERMYFLPELAVKFAAIPPLEIKTTGYANRTTCRIEPI